MSQTATRKDIDEVLDLLHLFMQQTSNELSDIKKTVSRLEESHGRLLNTIDAFVARIDRYETELAARDSQFQKLLDWARKVSDKTGIPLEHL